MFTAIIEGRWGGGIYSSLKRPSRWVGDVNANH